MEGKYSQTKTKKWPFFCVTVLLLLAVALGGWLYAGSRRIPENVTLGGLEIGGTTYREAKTAVNAAAEKGLLTKELRLVLPEETLVFSPKEAGLKLNTGKALGDALRLDGSGGENQVLGLLPYLSREEAYFRNALLEYGQKHDTELTQPLWQLDGEEPELGTDRFDPQTPGRNLTITLGIPQQHLDQKAAMEEILSFYDQALEPGREESFAISLTVSPEELPEAPDLDAIYESCCVSPVDDSLDMEGYQLVPGTYGCVFDLDEAKKEIGKAQWGETVSLPMEYVEPEILGEEVYFRDVLGTCETRHNDNENRNTNLRLICEILDGMVIEPGEEFSYNDRVGERTPERGFLPAPAYSGNRLIQDYGGGACQGSTTLYNCALLADMEITDRVCHGAAVGYVPRGLDAAVNWATNTDMAFRNTSHFPIKIQAKVEDGYVKMALLGTDEKDYTIEMKSGWGEDDVAIYATSYRCKISKETGEELSRTLEARSTYYKNLG